MRRADVLFIGGQRSNGRKREGRCERLGEHGFRPGTATAGLAFCHDGCGRVALGLGLPGGDEAVEAGRVEQFLLGIAGDGGNGIFVSSTEALFQ